MIEVEVVTSTVEYQGNNVTQIMYSDITDRKLAERDLTAREEKYRVLRRGLLQNEERNALTIHIDILGLAL